MPGMSVGRTGPECGNRRGNGVRRNRAEATQEGLDQSPIRHWDGGRTGGSGGANFRDGLVNPPPTGGIASSDY